MYDTFEDFFGITITQAQAVRHFVKHGHADPRANLIACLGEHATYDKGEVYLALGY